MPNIKAAITAGALYVDDTFQNALERATKTGDRNILEQGNAIPKSSFQWNESSNWAKKVELGRSLEIPRAICFLVRQHKSMPSWTSWKNTFLEQPRKMDNGFFRTSNEESSR